MGIRSALLAACLAVAGLAGPAQAQDEGPSAKCLACHSGELEKMARHPHAVAADSRNFGCVGCHGTSEKHAENPAEVKPDQRFHGKDALTGEEASAVCLMCHEGQNNKKLLLWAGSIHPQSGVACTSCHTVHVNKDPVFIKAQQSDVCFACHKDTRVATNKPFRHPLQEGKMACSDCHAPHGAAGPKLVKRDTTNATCYQCHAEKRGPYVHNHQPVQDNCASCHNPHGSHIAGMLTARDPILCNQCHVPHTVGNVGALRGQPGVLPPAVPPQAQSAVTPLSGGINTVNIWQGRSCLNCHTQVHGTNNPSRGAPVPSNLFR